MLRLENASLMRGNKLLFHGATLQFHRGQRVGIVGVNGCGKSSLFALILGELETESGEIHVNDHDEIAHVEQQSPSTDQPAIEYVMDGDREFRATEQEIVALEGTQDSAESQARLHELREHMDVIDGYTARSRAARLISGLGFAPGDELTRRPGRGAGGCGGAGRRPGAVALRSRHQRQPDGAKLPPTRKSRGLRGQNPQAPEHRRNAARGLA